MRRITLTALAFFSWTVVFLGINEATAQALENRQFQAALSRPLNYAMPLAGSPKALIVYGKNAAYTQVAAQAVQKDIQDWCGLSLDLADDQSVTDEKTWLLSEKYVKTPLIVLGNAPDNRVIHAMGTRFLARSNHSWPGGDRYVIRSVFEPFVADVNYLVLEASNQSGMEAATAKLTEMLKGFDEKHKTASTIPPQVHVAGGVKDKFERGWVWRSAPPEWISRPEASVEELIKVFKGLPYLAGTAAGNEGLNSCIWQDMIGGGSGDPPTKSVLTDANRRQLAAMLLLGCRAQNGRTHGNFDHYGALDSFNAVRAAIQSGLLAPQQVRAFESCIVLSTAFPLDYVYNAFGDPIDVPGGNRHFSASLVTAVNTADYILTHCRVDDRTRKEIERRMAAVRLTIDRYSRSFRDFDDSDMLGEDMMMHVSAFLHDGRMTYVKDGNLRKSADLYLFNTDNMPGMYGGHGWYVGLSGFSSCPGGIVFPHFGGGLLEEAAFYYDDPQLRWLAKNWAEAKGSRGGGYLSMFTDTVDKMTKPVVGVDYDGVRAVHFDRRLYELLQHADVLSKHREEEYRAGPESFDKALDRLAFRDDFNPDAAFMLLTGCSNPRAVKPFQDNMIARYTDLSQVWLYTNVLNNSPWGRNVVSISNGKTFVQRTGTSLDAMMNLGDVSAASSREVGVAGADWTRTIVHWRGHYFAVIDRMEANADDDFAYVCRWRCPQLAGLKDGLWTAVAPNGSKMTIQNTEPLFQTSDFWEVDGAARPYVLQQYKNAKLQKGQSQTFQNLIYVSATQRQDQFEAHQATATAMLVKGKTGDIQHLALVGVNGQIPLEGYQTDAAIYDVAGDVLHLAELTSLKTGPGGEMKETFRSAKPVNLMLDASTGKGQVENRSDAAVEVTTAQGALQCKPGHTDVTVAQAGALPATAPLIEALWAKSKLPQAGAVADKSPLTECFQAKTSDMPLTKPLRLLTYANFSANKPHFQHRNIRKWNSTDGLEITLSLPESVELGCLRIEGENLPAPQVVGRDQTGGEWLGTPGQYYKSVDDLKFTLVLSDDGFQNDNRKIDSPKVVWEYTGCPDWEHSCMRHYPTWRIEIGQKARAVKVLPRATTVDRPHLETHDIELYAAESVNELSAKVLAADVDGDGGNELVVATSRNELASFDATGKRLWDKHCDCQIMHLAASDLDGDGKAQTVAYLMTEKLLRINADGRERPGGDVLQAERDAYHGCWGVAGAWGMGIWAPDGNNQKEVLLINECPFRVLHDGSVKPAYRMGVPIGCGRLVNIIPGEPEVLVSVGGRGVTLWSAHRTNDNAYPLIASKPQVPGPDGGKLGWVQQVDAPGLKGFLAAYQGGINWYPAAMFEPNSKATGWGYSSGGVPATAAVAEDIDGDGVPEVFMGRQDGFVNLLKLSDGSLQCVLNAGEPVLGLAMLKGKDGKACLVVGTRFGVRLFGSDLKLIGGHKLTVPAAGFAGPGGQNKDNVYVVDAAGDVTVLTLK
jgi:hypothetical protein